MDKRSLGTTSNWFTFKILFGMIVMCCAAFYRCGKGLFLWKNTGSERGKGEKKMKRILTMLLIMTMAVSMLACGKKEEASTETTVYEDGAVIGEGATSFELTVVNMAGEEATFEVKTDEDTVGAALLENNMIAGEDGDYGLYVKTVNGETVDYDKDGKYWAFYINGEYGMTGVDATDIVEGDSYAFKAE